MSQQQEAPFVMCVVVLYCTPSGVLFTIMFFSLRRKIIKFATDLTFVYFLS